ncbi:phosphoglycerate kinase, partial [Candidatus Woesebacteria bacterium]|nr:phosphoglycerate kinase [Candidatus Woesebacteria bacterium]
PKITGIDVSGKKVLLRLDLDTEPDPLDPRVKASEETLNYLKDKGAKIIIIGHKGRPTGNKEEDKKLSLLPFHEIFNRWGAKVEENLRFDPGEEANDEQFAEKLSHLGDIYINEAFASSHRAHASIVALPRKFKARSKDSVALGFHFVKEIENLNKVIDNPGRPLVVIIGGIKKDKLDYLEGLESIADKVLVGGRLPEYLGEEEKSIRMIGSDEKRIVANLVMDKEDITLHSIQRFKEEISKAKTIVLAGPMGKYEEGGHGQGTKEIFDAIAGSNAFRVTGGGDTELALRALNVVIGFDWISVGGGAMLEFITKSTLPAIDVLGRER